MKKFIRKAIVDCSDENTFRFAILCEECKSQWKSTPYAFSKAGVMPETEAKKIIFQKLYQREWERARSIAIEEATQHFNLCPMCSRLVCDKCFMICDDLDMCVSCADRLEERGEAVAV